MDWDDSHVFSVKTFAIETNDKISPNLIFPIPRKIKQWNVKMLFRVWGNQDTFPTFIFV